MIQITHNTKVISTRCSFNSQFFQRGLFKSPSPHSTISYQQLCTAITQNGHQLNCWQTTASTPIIRIKDNESTNLIVQFHRLIIYISSLRLHSDTARFLMFSSLVPCTVALSSINNPCGPISANFLFYTFKVVWLQQRATECGLKRRLMWITQPDVNRQRCTIWRARCVLIVNLPTCVSYIGTSYLQHRNPSFTCFLSKSPGGLLYIVYFCLYYILFWSLNKHIQHRCAQSYPISILLQFLNKRAGMLIRDLRISKLLAGELEEGRKTNLLKSTQTGPSTPCNSIY